MTIRKPLPSISDAAWLNDPPLQAVMAALIAAGGDVRVAGGAVRNELMGEPVTEVDLATDLVPQQVQAAAEKAKMVVHPVGIEHGTVMVVSHGHAFEITTLRKDIETDGRRAKVAFTSNWEQDALRRDFTMNALYADRLGKIYDFTNGYADILIRRVRFVGNPTERIKEDYLRILRFFRFHARYSKIAPDNTGLAACKKLKSGLHTLSSERLRQETLKILEARRAVPTLKVMAQTGILRELLPHHKDWRVLQRLPADGLLRLMLLAKDPNSLKDRFRLSNDEARRIEEQRSAPDITPKLREQERKHLLYQMGTRAWIDSVHISHARSRATMSNSDWLDLVQLPDKWQPPKFPISGKDVMARGVASGPRVGQILQHLEDAWVATNFKLNREELLEMIET
jgi:poly(A) polymerase